MKQKLLKLIFVCSSFLLHACDKQAASTTADVQHNNATTPPPTNNNGPGNNLPANCLNYADAAVIQISGSSTTTVNTEVTLQVKFGVISGCGSFGRFEKSEVDFNHTIKLVAKYEGCICTANAPVLTTTYVFKALTPGIYYLKFKKSATQNIVHQITVAAPAGS